MVEKDYALGWLLAGVYQQADLADDWIFKGGTCLKKCFEPYRFLRGPRPHAPESSESGPADSPESVRHNRTTMSPTLDRGWHGLLFAVRKSVRYHERRQRFFLSCNRFISFVTAASGTAAVVTLLNDADKTVVMSIALLITLAGLMDLVFGTARRISEHGNLAREFVALERRMTLAERSPETLRELTAARLRIEEREPPILRVLNVLSHNDVMRSMGYPQSEWARVTPWQRRFAPFFDFRADRLTGELTT